jgi:ribose transport system ATP-binding protein
MSAPIGKTPSTVEASYQLMKAPMPDPAAPNILEMAHISKAFGGVQALREVSFNCRRGEVHALVGENGAGKSTLIKILAGAYQADSGRIVYKGETHEHWTTRDALDSGIRIIYQEFNLLPHMTIAENIFLGREPRTRLGLIDVQRTNAEARRLLERLHVRLDVRTPVSELSVAAQQMVEIAKALSQKADLIVMDEPSAILAGQELEQLFGIIESLLQEGVTIIYISHRLDEVFRVASQVTVLKDGQVVGTRPIQELMRPTLIQMMVGRSLDDVFPRAAAAPRGAPVLSVENVVGDPMPRGVSFTLCAGEILGVAGMVGSGRTELAQVLFGIAPLKAGRILVRGQEVHRPSPSQAIRNGLALIPEDRKTQGLMLGLPIRKNLSVVILDRLTQYGLIRRSEELQAVEKAQHDLSIVMESPEQEVQFLSGGNQQKVVLAKWLASAPSVVIMDEPTRGIDVGAKFEIYNLMRQLTDRSVAILMISSELTEILGMSDRILVMNDGQIAGELSGAEATEEKIMELAISSVESNGVQVEQV